MSVGPLRLIGGRLGVFATVVLAVVVVALVMAVVLNGSDADDPEVVLSASVSSPSVVEDGGDAPSSSGAVESAPESSPDPDVEGELELAGSGDPGSEADAAGNGSAVDGDEAVGEPDSRDASESEAQPDATQSGEQGEDIATGADPASLEPAVEVSPVVIRQGETVFVRLSGADAGSVLLTVDGVTTNMVAEGGTWVGFVPIRPLSQLGAYTVIVDWFDSDGVYASTELSEFSVVDAGVPVEQITLLPGDEDLLAPNLVAIDINVRFRENAFVSGPRLWTGPWIAPLPGNDTGIFGALRSYNGASPTDWHHGHDLDGETGAPIVAAAAGRVVFVGELPIHGSGVIVDHGAGVFSGYWHMSESLVQEGVMVRPGDVLGAVGSTGLAVGPHLHWEVIVRGQDVDPVQWLTASLHPR